MHAKQPIKIGIIVVAAGRGERAGSPEDGPKQYRPIGGKAIIAHTLEGFMTWRQALQIVVVIHRDDERLLAKALGESAKRHRSQPYLAARRASNPCWRV